MSISTSCFSPTLILGITIAFSGCASSHIPETSNAIVIRHVTIIPMNGTAFLPAHTVVVAHGRIAEVGPDDGVSVPRGAREVDGTGKYLIPGLFDMHSHMSKIRSSALGLYVVNGVTTIRDQGSEAAEVLRWRNEVRRGERLGPRMLIAGPYLESLRNIERMRADPPESRVEPFERARIAIASPEDARRVVDSLAAMGFDHLKVRTVQDEQTYRAIVAAAHRHGLKLVGHVVTASPAVFLEIGQDGVDHNFPMPALDSSAQRAAFWHELAKRDIGIVPTLIVATEAGMRSQAYFQSVVADSTARVHPLRPYLSAFLLLDWREQVEEASPERQAYFLQVWPQGLAQVREMHKAGVRLMTGTDVGVLNIFPGASLHEEIRLFVDSVGMTPIEALASATRKPAEWLGIADSVGTIERGKVADLVLLDANPLADINNTKRIAAVFLRGRLLEREELAAELAAVAAAADRRANDWIR